MLFALNANKPAHRVRTDYAARAAPPTTGGGADNGPRMSEHRSLRRRLPPPGARADNGPRLAEHRKLATPPAYHGKLASCGARYAFETNNHILILVRERVFDLNLRVCTAKFKI